MTLPPRLRHGLIISAMAVFGGSGAASATATFNIGIELSPALYASSIDFDNDAIAQGAAVGSQFSGATFQNFTFDKDTLGEDSAPGFSGDELVSGIATQPGGDLVIRFATPVVAAQFAIADSGAPRILSAFVGGPGGALVASTVLQLPEASSIGEYLANQQISQANAAVSLANLQLSVDQDTADKESQLVKNDNAVLEQANNLVLQDGLRVTEDKTVIADCGGDAACIVAVTQQLVKDTNALADANAAYSSVNAQLSLDEAKAALDQLTVDDDRTALANAKLQLAEADLAYQEAQLLDPGSGFVGLEGVAFDTLVLSDADSPTAIDSLDFTSLFAPPPPGQPSSPQDPTDAPEPATASLLAGALLWIAGLRRKPAGPDFLSTVPRF